MGDEAAIRLMTEGGDARILLDPATGLNRYFSAPRPSGVLAFASSTANDISAAAFAHVRDMEPVADGQMYAARLEVMRGRIRSAYGIAPDVEIVFAPSGTDLEYVALACTSGKARAGTHNILLGADEVGSGCIYSAHGRYFAESTALGIATKPGAPVPGLGDTQVAMIDVPVRDQHGRVRPSEEIARAAEGEIEAARAADRHPLLHVVHGSKTGLILPALADLDRLPAAHALTLVVDACQARITGAAIADYIERDAIVFITGSKFIGAPPFSGFALIPPALAVAAAPLPQGLATIFRRGEWPERWPGADILRDGANPGLLLRLEAALFELERFQTLGAEAVTRVILAFHDAIRREIVAPLGVRRVAPYPPGDRREADDHPIEMRTLSTIDLTPLGGASLDDAQAWHKALVAHDVRLGQPVKCVRLPDGSWGATLRIGLTMPQVVERSALDDEALAAAFAADMRRVAKALEGVSS